MADSKPIKSEDVIQKDVFSNTIKSGEDLLAVLDNLDKGFKQILTDQEKVLNESKKGVIDANKINQTTEALNKAKTARQSITEVEKQRLQVQKQLKASTDEEIKGKLRLQKAQKAQRDALKDLLILENQESGTLERLNAANRQLRREREKLNLETDKGRARLKEINLELDRNNKRIISNSDKLKKQRLNVGNYTTSVKEGIQASGLFSTQLAALSRIQATLNAILRKNTVETEANAAAQTTAQTATSGFSKALRVLKVALIGTGIGALVVALGALITAFAGTQRGVDAFTKVLRPLQALFQRFVGFLEDSAFKALDTLKKAFEDPKQAVIDLANSIKDNLIKRFESISVFGDAIAKLFRGEFAAGFKGLTDASLQLTTGVENATDKVADLAEKTGSFIDDSLKQGEELDALIKRLERRQVETIIPLQEARLEFQRLRGIAQDQNKSDQERIQALKDAEEQQRLITATEKELLDLRIEILETQQSFNDTSREEEEQLAKLKAQRLVSEEAAQKKINSVLSLRTGIEKRLETERQKEIDSLNEVVNLTNEINENKEKTLETDEQLADGSKERAEQAKKQLAEQEQARLKGIADAKEQQAEQIELTKEISNQTVDFAKQEIDEINQAKNEALDKETEEVKANITKQQELAAKGLENTLAFEKQKLAEAELEKKEQAQREARQKEAAQLAEVFLSAYLAELDKPDSDPFTAGAKALGATVLAKGIARGLASGFAFDGVEDTGGSGGLDSKGGSLWMLHPHERVMSRKQNELVGDISNDELSRLAYDYRLGNLMPEVNVIKQPNNDNKKVIASIEALRKDINSKPIQQVNVDSLGNLIETVYTNSVKDTIKYKTRKRL
jgi:hypothetical protein